MNDAPAAIRPSESLLQAPLFMKGVAQGDSMRGVIEPGEEFKIMQVPFILPEIGDVVMFVIPQGPRKGQMASHVVIGRDKDGNILTRGANNSFDDPWCCTPEMFKGKVINKKFDVSKFAPATPTRYLPDMVVTASRVR